MPTTGPKPPGEQPPPAMRQPARAPAVQPPEWPIKRKPQEVIVLPPTAPVLPTPGPSVPLMFVPPLIFKPVLVPPPLQFIPPPRLVWENSVTLTREQGWADFTLGCNTSGTRLLFEVSDGRLSVDWAEVVFDDHVSQLVDFHGRSIGPGFYTLLDLRGRHVEYVRMVAKSSSRLVRLTLRMER